MYFFKEILFKLYLFNFFSFKFFLMYLKLNISNNYFNDIKKLNIFKFLQAPIGPIDVP